MNSNCKTTAKMPFFWSNSGASNDRNKLEHKMCIAKETPEPVFDLSECNLIEIPSGVFSMCRVFRKEVLSLHDNKITSLNGGGTLQDLSALKILDLHSNKLSILPEDIGLLTALKVLNLQDNKLKKLPDSMQNMKCLQVLNIGGNKFTEFPFVLCKLQRLQTLDISNNKIINLPKEFSLITTLQTVHLDVEKFKYPSSDICKEGTEKIMRYLCAESDKEYIPPLDDDKLELEIPVESTSCNEVDLPDTYDVYQRAKEKRRLELLQMEEEMYNNQESQSQIAINTQLRRKKLLENVVEEQEKLYDEILQLQCRKDKEKQNLLYALSCLEEESAKLIDDLMVVNEKSKNTETLLELMERDRKETEELFSLKQEELENLRKKEVITAMKCMLEAEEKHKQYEADRLEIKKQLQKDSLSDDERIHYILSGREQDQIAMITELLEKEQYQKQAFQALQVQRDLKHIELTHHIKQIQKELTKLTTAELKRKDLKLNFELNILAERRSKLAELLSNLLEQRERREAELKERIHQMDEQRKQEMNDFWLIQYQRLMDRKPQHIEELEKTLDPSIQSILINAEAQDYLTLFAAKHITLQKLLSMTTEDLKKFGIIQDNICENIVKSANYYQKSIEATEENISTEDIPNIVPMPSAPPRDERELPSAPILTPSTEIKIWYQIECVVCLEKESQAVFLPCGHVCCCWSCGELLNTCPMCRAEISNRFLNVS